MLLVLQRLFLAALGILAFLLPAQAQEFRIYTQVTSPAAAPEAGDTAAGGAPVIARSWTIFHAGKVYDYVDTVREVIIFEPTRDRFTVLSLNRNTSTVVALEELKHLLKMAEQEAHKYLGELSQDGSPHARTTLGALQFQLQPAFDTTFDAKTSHLKLASPWLHYEADCTQPLSPDLVAAYARYADWTCRLNSVLHPQSLFPAPRLLLNEELRQRAVMPVNVDLRIKLDTPLHLRAEHQIRWELDARDRELIHYWETQVKNPDVKQVTLREFQREMLTGNPPSRR
jgi:hypothetical protein